LWIKERLREEQTIAAEAACADEQWSRDRLSEL
jgi:hypothetical protein